jgi:nucleoside-diphosphate-sugar epimerase
MGFSVHALVRKTSTIGDLQRPEVDLHFGDVSDARSMEPSLADVDYVVHAAVDTSGTEEGARNVTIGGTLNILDLCAKLGVKKLIYISSCSVYGTSGCSDGQIIDESSPTEQYPERRGLYSWAKLEAEKLVLSAMAEGKIAITCLRPGTIYGPRSENFLRCWAFPGETDSLS